MPTDKPFRMWIAHPDLVVYVHHDDESVYSTRPGWWRTEWCGSADDVQARTGKPADRPSPPPPVDADA